MQRHAFILLAALMAVSTSCLADTNTPELTTGIFDILPSIGEKIDTVGSALTDRVNEDGFIPLESTAPEAERSNWKEFFSNLGMTWPEGSSIKYIPAIGSVVVKNTRENLEVFQSIISVTDCVAYQIEVEALCLSIPKDAILPAWYGDGVTRDVVLKLLKEGKAEVLWAPRVITQSGLEAIIQSPRPMDKTSRKMSLPPQAPPYGKLEVQAPCLQILPEVSPEGRFLNLTLSLDGIQTSLTIEPGATILLGGGVPSAEKEHLQYVLITTHLINAKGERHKVRKPFIVDADGDLTPNED